MSDQNLSTLLLEEPSIRRGIELLYFGHSHLTKSIDERLASQGLGRAHHRALYFIARAPGLTVSDLLRLLAITKQSLGRVLKELQNRGLVAAQAGVVDRREKRLRLTADGEELEKQLFEDLRARMTAAYRHAGLDAQIAAYWSVLEGLIPDEERARLARLQSG